MTDRKPWEGRTQFQVYIETLQECARLVRGSDSREHAELLILDRIPEAVKRFDAEQEEAP